MSHTVMYNQIKFLQATATHDTICSMITMVSVDVEGRKAYLSG